MTKKLHNDQKVNTNTQNDKRSEKRDCFRINSQASGDCSGLLKLFRLTSSH